MECMEKKSAVPKGMLGAVILAAGLNAAASGRHTFSLGRSDFLMDGRPVQIISGEIHPARIPMEYWRHRIRMVKSLGCNTVSAYLFWNHFETEPGRFDFKTENRDVTGFFTICREEGMWALLRPGPYVCAEWDFGGLPPYLLRTPDIRIRCMDPVYMAGVERYLTVLAALVKPLLVTNGGPILMIQIENEYGSYGNDGNYLEALRDVWRENGVEGPFFTGDGPTPYMLEAGTIDGAAIGLDSGSSAGDFEEAEKRNPDVPSFSSETYPGWLTHWGEPWAKRATAGLLAEVRYLLENRKSFNFYVAHGGTNFGFSAGANSGGKGYEPDVTSYDYDAPIDEQGRPTPKYFALRNLIARYVSGIPDLPEPVPVMETEEIKTVAWASVWSNLPQAVASVQPKPFEAYNQDYGFILYRTRLIGHKSGKLAVTELHDYALVFLNGAYVGKLDRREGEKEILLPESGFPEPVLEIFVEGMGRINYGQTMVDRKGITDRVTLNGMTLMNWEVFNLPFDSAYVRSLRPAAANPGRRGVFFKGSFNLDNTADTFFDMTRFKKGVVWVNGRNLGRYWEIGPQRRLFCPAPWLQKGRNEILIFDLHQTEPGSVKGMGTLE
jgi:beta-galactosidase GanA